MVTEETFSYWYKARVTAVYDGDSITAEIDLGCYTFIHDEKVRLKGINTPELRGETLEAGIAARDALRGLILGREVIINTYLDRGDKYGRLLGVIYAEGVNVNQWLVMNGYAVEYNG